MSLDKISPTVEDFRQTDWQSIICQSKERTCDAYYLLSRTKMSDAETSGNIGAQQVFGLLFHVCLVDLGLDTPNVPYGVDFTAAQLDTLQTILPDIADAELRARVADILWAQKHGDYRNAQVAARAYLESARILEDPTNWVGCAHRIERALQIALQLGKKNALYNDVISHIVATLDKYQGEEDPLFLSAHLMKLLLDAKEGDSSKYAALSEKAARLAESASDNLKWHRARTQWTVNARWNKANCDEERGRQALIMAAETYVKEAEDVLQHRPQPYSGASYFIQHAIEAYRQIEGTETRRGELHKLLIGYQEKSVEEMRPYAYWSDISHLVDEAANLVKGKMFHEALVSLALYPASPNVQMLRKRVEDYSHKYGLTFWLSASMLDKEGKTKGIRPGIGNADSEVVIHPEMLREAQRMQGLLAEAIVFPAIMQINAEHHFREADFLPLVVDNPFVPRGREMLFARGLCAGLNGDMLVASHILIPQLENSVRYILEQQGHIVSGLDKDRIQDEYALNKILYTYKVELQEILGSDLLFDLQGLLIERFGSNLRNLVAHGLLDGSAFTSRQMVYLWWLILRLCCLPLCARAAPS